MYTHIMYHGEHATLISEVNGQGHSAEAINNISQTVGR